MASGCAGRLCIQSKASDAGGIVVWVWGFLRGTIGLGDVAEIYSDAIPDVAGATHAVGEDVIDGEMFCSVGMFFFPASEAGFRGGFVRRLCDGEEWVFWGAGFLLWCLSCLRIIFGCGRLW